MVSVVAWLQWRLEGFKQVQQDGADLRHTGQSQSFPLMLHQDNQNILSASSIAANIFIAISNLIYFDSVRRRHCLSYTGFPASLDNAGTKFSMIFCIIENNRSYKIVIDQKHEPINHQQHLLIGASLL